MDPLIFALLLAFAVALGLWFFEPEPTMKKLIIGITILIVVVCILVKFGLISGSVLR